MDAAVPYNQFCDRSSGSAAFDGLVKQHDVPVTFSEL